MSRYNKLLREFHKIILNRAIMCMLSVYNYHLFFKRVIF